MTALPLIVLCVAAAFEVGGDAVIRTGLRGHRLLLTVVGMLMLALYGLVVNQLRWEFARLLGVYVGVFALTSVLVGRWIFGERPPPSTLVGLALILAGGAVIQLGKQ
ncbi:MAG TPA: hypothetical protein VH879_06660 [Gemmatimonadales bacterium]|jgi:drug/metabolite transporter superfamily protein YnfA